MTTFIEIIENQRWYPILGWSSGLKEDDPPAWCTPQRVPCRSKDEQQDDGYSWQIYKAEDYDEEGWLYSTTFDDDWGPMTRTSVVRTRIWMGKKVIDGDESTRAKDEKRIVETTVKSDNFEQASGIEDAPKVEEWQGLFGSDKPDVDSTKYDGEETNSVACESTCEDDPNSLFGSAQGQCEKVLFPTKASSKKAQPGLFGKISAAALSIPTSVIHLAGSSSKQALKDTVDTIKEVSVYALDHAQAATVAALTSEPHLPASSQKDQRQSLSSALDAKALRETQNETLSTLSKRFPHLSPLECSLVTCCADEVSSHMAPPEPTISRQCKSCGHEFGMTKFRYQCGYCCDSFCRDHLPHSSTLRAYGQANPTKICIDCYYVIEEKIKRQQIAWRIERVNDFLADKLIAYFNTSTDTTVDKIMRAAEGTLAAAKSAPIGATAKAAVVSADFLRKYGRAGLLGFILRNEFMQSFSTLKGLIGGLDDIGFQDAAIGTYYFMAMNRGERGANPDGEQEAHRGCAPVTDDLLNDILRYAPLALHAIYELDVLDIQRISRLQNFSLVYAHIQNQDVRHPSFALLGNKQKKIALVLIRGSKSVQDLLTDIQAHPEEMGLSSDATSKSETTGGFVDAFAHNGMLKAAMWIKDHIVNSLRKLHNEGFKIVFAGHSLGAGCAALLSVMLQKEFADVQCFAYAVPACVNLSVAESCQDFVHSIVLRDDFVPRAKASNIVKLVEELKEFKGCWRDTASEDIEAFKDRAKTLWAPRKREWAQEQAEMRKGKIPSTMKNTKIVSSETEENERGTKPVKSGENEQISTWTLTRTNLIDQLDKSSAHSNADDTIVPTEARQAEQKILNELVTTLMDDPRELYIPGQVTHVYFNKGIYEAAHVDRKCDALARIPVFQNMLSDHLGRNYLNALRIVRDSRRMNPTLPEWVKFGTKTRCMCCDAPFTWNSTSSSEAQQNRDQHNCRKCGSLVCEGCSEKWKSIPEFGINVPVRVCDRCTYDL